MANEYELSALELYHKGLYYENVEKNISLSIKYYEFASLKGDVISMYKLGLYYQQMGKSKLIEYYYLNAIGNGHIESMYNLALYYYDIENDELWMKYLLMSVELHDERSIYFMGMYYQYIEIDYNLMKKYYHMLIDEELIDSDSKKISQYQIRSLCNLGIYYLEIEKNTENMLKYCLLASNNDNIKSIYYLGKYYFELGPNIENYNQMKKYFNKIIEINESNKSNFNDPDMDEYLPNVLFILGWYYMNIEINIKLAKHYYLLAHYKDNIHATYNLGLYFLFVEKDYVQVKVFFHMLINDLNSIDYFGFSKNKLLSESLFILGWFYHNIELNKQLAIQYYSMALDKDNDKSLNNLKLLYSSNS